MFLKRIELQGFKSFADKTIIRFDHNMIGIVGPNGCGKSNINDAIRWVLGEQSIKSLRASNMSDVIFSGSTTKKSVNIAKVSLIFDNTKRYFDLDFDEVEITRVLHRIDNENEYFINKTPCRLKDITNLVLDSGLGKDSLSIISQGNISSFAEAKPYERRVIFEEAASVAKYKKRKTESINKLERTNENIIRLEDILNELEKQVTPLKSQAEKAKIFIEKEKRLKEIEITVIVDNIEKHIREKSQQTTKLSDITIDINQKNQFIEENDIKNEHIRKQMYRLDFDINQLQEKFLSHVNEIKSLEARKIEIEEKRKYAKENSDNLLKKQLLFDELSEINFEYENRQTRFKQLQHELNFAKNELQTIQSQLVLHSQEENKTMQHLTQIKNDINVINRLITQPFLSQQGVKNILEAKHIQGIYNTVNNCFKPIKNYEIAIGAALNSMLYHVLVENSEVGKIAVKYLKQNNAGRATFLPINLMQPRTIKKEHLIVCESVLGYLGVASDFVVCDDKFINTKLALLGNIFICDTIDAANQLAHLLNHQYKIITLDGDVIHRGGSITGGSLKQTNSIYTLESDKEKLNIQENEYHQVLQSLRQTITQLTTQKNNIENDILKIQLNIAKLSTVIDNISNKKEKITAEYEMIQVDGEFEFDDRFVKALSDAYELQDKINSDLQSKREQRFNLSHMLELSENQLRETRRVLNTLLQDQKAIELSLVKTTTMLENEMDILRSQYQMTYDYALTQVIDVDVEVARQEVLALKNAIAKLGNVNLDAPAQYEEVSSRYHNLKDEIQQLLAAKTDILHAIDEMDTMMKTQFKTTFDKINDQLNIVFKSLFPTGQATLVLTDPLDLLETGIDVNVSFPGKTLKNIKLFSGGEKALVAICVLFAIIKARTMPLCIFDEVEAALDQVNVDKFANYIASLKDETQFIVVTHRPGTMVKCDALFGVTMQQAGVSNILSVQLNDAISMIK